MEATTSVTDSSVASTAQVLNNTSNSSSTEKTKDVKATSVASDDFSKFMKAALGGDTKKMVNEEELFAALIEQRLNKDNAEAATFFHEQMSTLGKSMAKPNGYIPVEDVAKAALKATVAAGKVEMEKAELINGEAFAGAQLDANKDALYDSIGGGADETVATAEVDGALTSIKDIVDKIESGTLAIEKRSLDIPSNSVSGSVGASGGLTSLGTSSGVSPTGTQKLDGSGGFLWKPVSDSDGKLVVLLPTSFNGNIDRVELHSSLPPSAETLLDKGRFSSIGNGDRSHFRFSKPGGDYPEGTNVVVYKDDGSTSEWTINDTSARND